MRRAVVHLAFLCAALLPVSVVEAQEKRGLLDGAGMIEYGQAPQFKVGSWVRYRTTGRSLLGYKDDYTVTIMIAGEEDWWGERCFWVETWLEEKGHKNITASMVTYEAFGDTMAKKNFPWFLRKTIQGTDDKGVAQEVAARRDQSDFKSRSPEEPDPTQVTREPLPPVSTTVPAGSFDTKPVLRTSRLVEQVTRGDSTFFYERVEKRTIHYSDQIPITRYVREDIDDVQQGKSWRIGESSKAGPLKLLEQARGETVLIGYGDKGVTPELVPERYRVSLKPAVAPKPARKTGGKSG